MSSGVKLRLAVPPAFSLRSAVCSYGFFMMAPNSWSPAAAILERPLHLCDGRAVVTSVWEGAGDEVVIRVEGVDKLDGPDRDSILAQVQRMLRLSPEENAMVNGFQAVHSQAKSEGFGRLFRSPTLFEDMVKSLLLCNCGWPRTLSMTRALCELQAELKGAPLGYTIKHSHTEEQKAPAKTYKRRAKTVLTRSTSKSRARSLQQKFCKEMEEAVTETEMTSVSVSDNSEPEMASVSDKIIGAFPTAEELAGLDPGFLAKRCGLGYRVGFVMMLAKGVSSGTVQLSKLEGPDALSGEQLRSTVSELSGFGPFSCANVMMLLGNYSTIPADSETVRHLRDFHGKSNANKKNVAQIVASMYEHCKPFEFLAYWWEIWHSYEQRFGDLAKMPATDFRLITGPNMRKPLLHLP